MSLTVLGDVHVGHLREAGNVLRQVGDLVARCREGNDNGMIQYCDAAELSGA